MNQIVWVSENDPLPCVRGAKDLDVLAAGLDLSPSRLKEAYSKGMFPWFSDGEPVLWWSPDPRMILMSDELHVSKSFSKLLRQLKRDEEINNPAWKVTTNLAFEDVINSCGKITQTRSSTWITNIIKQTYTMWHHQGHVNSIEVWYQDKLIGGLYGVLLGRFFFGESMFSNANNASKIALFYLTRLLIDKEIMVIDCQQETDHLTSLGGKTIDRNDFLDMLDDALQFETPFWHAGQITQSGKILNIDT